MKSKFVLVNQLKDSLLEFPDIVNNYKSKNFIFIEKIFNWIDKNENILRTHGIPTVSKLSGIKASIVASKYLDSERGSKARQVNYAGSELYNIQSVVLNIYNEHNAVVEESRVELSYLLNIVIDSKVVIHDKKKDISELVDIIWMIISNHEQLKGKASLIKSKINLTDIKMLLFDMIKIEDYLLQ